MMHWAEASQAAAYLSVVAGVEERAAARLGCTVGCLRVLVRVSAMRQHGVRIGVLDLVRAGLGQADAVRVCVADAVAGGWLVRGGPRGVELDTTTAGRVAVRELVRSWERARRELAA